MSQCLRLTLTDLASKKQHYINMALEEAKKSPVYQSKHGCIIIKDGHVISVGHNDYQKTPLSGFFTTHAEVSALMNLGDMNALRGADMYVVRLNRDSKNMLKVRYSEPCSECRKKLLKCMRVYGLRNVYYSTDM